MCLSWKLSGRTHGTDRVKSTLFLLMILRMLLLFTDIINISVLSNFLKVNTVAALHKDLFFIILWRMFKVKLKDKALALIYF